MLRFNQMNCGSISHGDDRYAQQITLKPYFKVQPNVLLLILILNIPYIKYKLNIQNIL